MYRCLGSEVVALWKNVGQAGDLLQKVLVNRSLRFGQGIEMGLFVVVAMVFCWVEFMRALASTDSTDNSKTIVD